MLGVQTYNVDDTPEQSAPLQARTMAHLPSTTYLFGQAVMLTAIEITKYSVLGTVLEYLYPILELGWCVVR